MTSGVRTPPDIEAEIIRLYGREKLPIEAVHAKTGVSEQVISRVIHDAGISRGPGRRPRMRPEIEAACDAGLSCVQAAALCGVSVTTVRAVMAPRVAAAGMLTAGRAAAVLGISPQLMTGLARAGVVRTVRPWPKARLLYDAADVAALAAIRARVTGQLDGGRLR